MTYRMCVDCLALDAVVDGKFCLPCWRDRHPPPKQTRQSAGWVAKPPSGHAWRAPYNPGPPQKQERPTLPAGFLTTDQAAEKRGFSIRTARNRASDHRIGVKRGREWWVYEPGLDALAADDTGGLVDAQRHLETMSDD